MDTEMFVKSYWAAIAEQDENKIRDFFAPDARIRWHNTNEDFNVEEFLRANCEYPGEWEGETERIECIGSRIVSAAHVWSKDQTMSFHAASFFSIEAGKIKALDEYWGEDGDAPQWRLEKRIGKPIRNHT